MEMAAQGIGGWRRMVSASIPLAATRRGHTSSQVTVIAAATGNLCY